MLLLAYSYSRYHPVATCVCGSAKVRRTKKTFSLKYGRPEQTNSSHALRSTLKVTDKLTKIYNDAIFGGISWSQDESKICFIGEVPEPAVYKNHWEAKKSEEEEKGCKQETQKEESQKKEENKEEHFQDEKFLLNRDFGEMMVGKKNPAIFIFDLEKNAINQV